MAKPNAPRRRTLLTFSEPETKKLVAEAKAKGLKLATYIRSIVISRTASDRAK